MAPLILILLGYGVASAKLSHVGPGSFNLEKPKGLLAYLCKEQFMPAPTIVHSAALVRRDALQALASPLIEKNPGTVPFLRPKAVDYGRSAPVIAAETLTASKACLEQRLSANCQPCIEHSNGRGVLTLVIEEAMSVLGPSE